MSGILRYAAVGLVMASILSTKGSTQQSATAAALVLDGVTVVDVKQGELIPNQRVVIRGNRIQAVGARGTVQMPPGAQVVDAEGKYLIPGLWDLHVHPQTLAYRFYPFFIANGITGIRDAGSEVPIDTLRLWQRDILAGTRVGPPRQILSGQSIAGPEPGCRRTRTHDPQTCVASVADAVQYIDSLQAAGADMIKPRHVTRPLYFAIAAEARRRGMPFGGHAEAATTAEASDSGAVIVDHPYYRTTDKLRACWGASASVEACRPLAERLRRNGTWLALTMVRTIEHNVIAKGMAPSARKVFARLTAWAEDFWAGASFRGNWLHDSTSAGTADTAGALSVMQRVGMPLLAGTDVVILAVSKLPPGFALHTELAMYVAEGMTPLAALQSATLNPAQFLGGTDSLGTVAPGKLADLVLLEANPLADITNTTTIRAVVANGRYFDREALDRMVADIVAKKAEPWN